VGPADARDASWAMRLNAVRGLSGAARNLPHNHRNDPPTTARPTSALTSQGHSPMIEAPAGLAELLVTFIAEDWDDFESIRKSVE